MLQRVQSVYLFLVFVFAILFFVLPIGQFITDTAVFSFRLLRYGYFFEHTGFSANLQNTLLIILWASILILTLVMIFQYRKRMLQIRLGKLNMLLHVFLIMLTFFFLDGLRSQADIVGFNYGAGVVFPVVSLLFILMAIRAIRKDEELVRSADRFR